MLSILLSAARHSPLYKTDDLGRWLSDGNIEFLGRIDHQVKIRGFRIELGEIESRLMAADHIKEAVVIDGEDRPGERYLCAYIVSGAGVDISLLRGRQYVPPTTENERKLTRKSLNTPPSINWPNISTVRRENYRQQER